MNIVFIERIFPLYRKAVYDALHRKTGLLFLHTVCKKSGIKQTKAGYSSIVSSLHYGSKESQILLFTLKKLLRKKPAIIVHEFSAGIVSIPFLLLFCRLQKIKLIFWGHMYDRNKGFCPQKKLVDKYRLWLWKKADCLITYAEAERQLVISYGVQAEKAFVAFNTVDTATLLKIRNRFQQLGKRECKERIGLKHRFNLTFIGRLYAEKKPDLLLDLLAELKQRGFNSVAVHYVGSGEMLSQLKEKRKTLGLTGDVFFHGAIYDDDKSGEILFCSDLMVMPGCVGLSVNHAFCFNCPVVTFEQVGLHPAHGPEIEYVVNKKTGFIIPGHSIEALANTVAEYLASEDLQKTMKKEVRCFIETEGSVEQMAEGVIQAIAYTSEITNK